MPRETSKGESKQGLVITLVFFILATIGLGVATYFGFADQAEKEKLAKDANDKKKLIEEDRDWYKFQAQIYRSYMGETQNINPGDLNTRREQYMTDRLGTKATDKQDVDKVIKEKLDKELGWNAKENRPERTFQDLLATKEKEKDALLTKISGLEKAKEQAQKQAKEQEELAKEAQKNLDTKLAEQAKKNTDDLSGDRKTIDDLRNEIARLGTEIENLKKKGVADQQALVKQIKEKDQRMAKMKELLDARNAELAQVQVKSKEAPPSMRTDWRIVYMDPRGTNPYINLGSVDKVKPQLTFSIHGVTTDGRPISEAKGTLEVVNVIGEHVSQTRITSVKDQNRDPILKGDVLYNPSWNPTIKKHVALAGVIDLTGDGRDSLYEFMRNLERQSIIVDAYLDPKDFQVKGKVTVRTDFLIIGESLEFQITGREKNPEFHKKLDKGIRDMKDQANANGVAIKSLSQYLEMIGYRLPRSTGEQSGLYNPTLRPDQAPRIGGDKTPPPPDKR
jgi:hypothetical protein